MKTFSVLLFTLIIPALFWLGRARRAAFRRHACAIYLVGFPILSWTLVNGDIWLAVQCFGFQPRGPEVVFALFFGWIYLWIVSAPFMFVAAVVCWFWHRFCRDAVPDRSLPKIVLLSGLWLGLVVALLLKAHPVARQSPPGHRPARTELIRMDPLPGSDPLASSNLVVAAQRLEAADGNFYRCYLGADIGGLPLVFEPARTNFVRILRETREHCLATGATGHEFPDFVCHAFMLTDRHVYVMTGDKDVQNIAWSVTPASPSLLNDFGKVQAQYERSVGGDGGISASDAPICFLCFPDASGKLTLLFFQFLDLDESSTGYTYPYVYSNASRFVRTLYRTR